MAYPECVTLIPGLVELRLEVIFCLIEGFLHLIIGILQHAVLIH